MAPPRAWHDTASIGLDADWDEVWPNLALTVAGHGSLQSSNRSIAGSLLFEGLLFLVPAILIPVFHLL